MFQKILCMLYSLFFLSLPVLAAEESQSLRVACILDGGFFSESENGDLSGYNYDYLRMIAQHTGWEYEFVLIDQGSREDSYDEAMRLVEEGELDLLGSMFKTPEREEIFLYTDSPVGICRYTLVSLVNNYKITADNFFLKEFLTVVLVEGDPINGEFLEMAEAEGLNIVVTYVPTYEEALGLLISEQAETMIVEDSSQDSWMLNNLTTINRIPFYFVTGKDNEDVVHAMENALEKIAVEEPNVHQRLLSEYFATLHQGAIILTKEEEEALAHYDYLTVGLLKGREPYQFYVDEEEEIPRGISVEILEQISQIIGKEFRYVWLESRQEMQEKIASREIDICSTVPFDSAYELAYYFDVVITQPYLTNAVVWLHHEDEKRNAIPYYYYITDHIPFFSKEEMVEVTDLEATLEQLVQKGDITLFADPYMAQYHLQQLGVTNVEMQTISTVQSKICFGVGKHLDSAVVGLLNHSLLHLDPFVIDEIIYSNVTDHGRMTVDAFFAAHRTQILTIVTIFLTLVVLSLIYHSRKLKNLSQQDSLTKLYNAGYFHTYLEERSKKNQKGCLILMDIDFFKQVNDTYGHQQGDRVIIRVADTLRKHFSKDTIARLGGDEFILFLDYKPEISDLEERCRQILQTLAQEENGISATLSIGGYIYESQTEYSALYHLADQVLYKVKEQGRNGYLFSSDST